MSDLQILYEANLATVGSKLTWAGAGLSLFLIAGGVMLCIFDSAMSLAVLIVGMAAAGCIAYTVRLSRLRKNPGVYRISIDDYGLYAHSDAPSFAPSFTIVAPDIYGLVRKTVRQGDSDEHEYYIETRSGARHRIGQLFADYDLDIMKTFEIILERFPWVKMIEESEP